MCKRAAPGEISGRTEPRGQKIEVRNSSGENHGHNGGPAAPGKEAARKSKRCEGVRGDIHEEVSNVAQALACEHN
jgi:hypothetical protein